MFFNIYFFELFIFLNFNDFGFIYVEVYLIVVLFLVVKVIYM